jgi:hypothetical protein
MGFEGWKSVVQSFMSSIEMNRTFGRGNAPDWRVCPIREKDSKENAKEVMDRSM